MVKFQFDRIYCCSFVSSIQHPASATLKGTATFSFKWFMDNPWVVWLKNAPFPILPCHSHSSDFIGGSQSSALQAWRLRPESLWWIRWSSWRTTTCTLSATTIWSWSNEICFMMFLSNGSSFSVSRHRLRWFLSSWSLAFCFLLGGSASSVPQQLRRDVSISKPWRCSLFFDSYWRIWHI